MDGWMGGWVDGWMGGREGGTEGRRDGGTEGRRDGGTEGRRDGGTEGRRDGGTEGRRDGGTDGWMDGCMYAWTDGRTDGMEWMGGCACSRVNVLPRSLQPLALLFFLTIGCAGVWACLSVSESAPLSVPLHVHQNVPYIDFCSGLSPGYVQMFDSQTLSLNGSAPSFHHNT